MLFYARVTIISGMRVCPLWSIQLDRLESKMMFDQFGLEMQCEDGDVVRMQKGGVMVFWQGVVVQECERRTASEVHRARDVHVTSCR
jgi:hypothetical protein